MKLTNLFRFVFSKKSQKKFAVSKLIRYFCGVIIKKLKYYDIKAMGISQSEM